MSSREPMLDLFIFETFEMIEKLQQLIMNSEKEKTLTEPDINEIFRIMHTIKGSSGMMMFDNISRISHKLEDIFYFIRESKPNNIDYSMLTDMMLEGSDLIKEETDKIDNNHEADGDFTQFINKADDFLNSLKVSNGETNEIKKEEKLVSSSESTKFYIANDKSTISNEQCYTVKLFFEANCEMENIRCFTVVHNLKEIANVIYFYPEDIIENNDSCEIIREQGFLVSFTSKHTKDELNDYFSQTIFLSRLEIEETIDESKVIESTNSMKISKEELKKEIKQTATQPTHKQNLINVDVEKLDKLMDLVGELVISEAMVTKNSDLQGLNLDSFYKAARQHRKRLNDLQDVVMSIRMVPLSPTLNKMNRIVRDMCKKLEKDAELILIGQDTEVDKNIIEHISDPLMHIVRNSMDHGIESSDERTAIGKHPKGKIIIEAKNTGGEVLIIIKDDGKGLDKDKILKKAKNNGLLKDKNHELSDKEIYSLIFVPGFSTNENVTEYSGRGVGMDVVTKEIEKIRGSVTVDSEREQGTTITIKIPLTLAIIDGMTIKVGNTNFTLPVTSIRQSFIIRKEEIVKDLNDKEMILIRGDCYSILRLHEIYNIRTETINIEDGIVIMVEDGGKTKCIFADKLLGEQQVVIKALPDYIKNVKGVSGCTLLGDGNISLILDVSEIVNQ